MHAASLIRLCSSHTSTPRQHIVPRAGRLRELFDAVAGSLRAVLLAPGHSTATTERSVRRRAPRGEKKVQKIDWPRARRTSSAAMPARGRKFAACARWRPTAPLSGGRQRPKSGTAAVLSRRYALPQVVGHVKRQPSRRARSLACADSSNLHGRKHAWLGSDLEWPGTRVWVLDAEKEGSSINELEFIAAVHGVREFASLSRGQQVQLVSNSRVTVRIVRNCTSRSPRLLAHLRILRAV
jgi:hypothetical protein